MPPQTPRCALPETPSLRRAPGLAQPLVGRESRLPSCSGSLGGPHGAVRSFWKPGCGGPGRARGTRAPSSLLTVCPCSCLGWTFRRPGVNHPAQILSLGVTRSLSGPGHRRHTRSQGHAHVCTPRCTCPDTRVCSHACMHACTRAHPHPAGLLAGLQSRAWPTGMGQNTLGNSSHSRVYTTVCC